MAKTVRDLEIKKKQDDTRFKLDRGRIPVVLCNVEGSVSDSVSTLVDGTYEYSWYLPYGTSSPAQVLNRRVPFVAGMPVYIGWLEDSNEIEVIGINYSLLKPGLNIPKVEAHATSHLYGGFDPLPLERRMLTMLKTTANGVGLKVNVSPLEYDDPDGGAQFFSGLNGYSLTASQPGAGLKRYTLVYLNKSTGVLGVVNGSTVADSPAITPVKPDTPANGESSAYVLLNDTVSTLLESHIIDARRILSSEMAHASSHENAGADEINVAGLSGELADAQPVAVSKNSGAIVGTRSEINFIEGTNITLTVSDDAGNDEIDITIASSGGGNVWPKAGEAGISDTQYATIELMLAALAANQQGIIGEGTYTTSWGTGGGRVPTGADVKGSGVGVTILTSADSYTLEVEGQSLVEQMTIQCTKAVGPTAFYADAGADVRLDTIKAIATATSDVPIGYQIVNAAAVLVSCEAYASGGSSDYAVYVFDNSTGSSATIRKGYYSGDVVADGSGATIDLKGPTITGSVTEANSGTITGWYYDTSGNKLSAPSSTPTLGSTTAAQKWGNIYLATTKDLYPKARNAGAQQRLESWLNPTGYIADQTWTWAVDAPFDGTPSTVDSSTYPDLLNVHDGTVGDDHFYYMSVSPTAGTGITNFYCRVAQLLNSYAGIRIDAGSAANTYFFEIRIVDSATAGMKRLEINYGAGGAPTQVFANDPMPPAFLILRVQKFLSANVTAAYASFNTPIPVHNGVTHTAVWTPARVGIIFGQRAFTGVDRSGLYGEYKVSVT